MDLYNALLSASMGRTSAGLTFNQQNHVRGCSALLLAWSFVEGTSGEVNWAEEPDQVRLLRFMRNAIAHADCDMARLDRRSADAAMLMADDFSATGGNGFYVLDDDTPTKFWLFPMPSGLNQMQVEVRSFRQASWLFAVLQPYMHGTVSVPAP